ncbi:hypothetical protein [Spirosoma sp. KNUC1025]|uniref:hypothetical protein n=1 Tax=Spirosoma sp. KNUC1025 TaxID=2894082 RepID=UPI003865E2D2|nr:hypothetical protein LN737_15270 [Spirosoma sp. KNUC1025]
MSCLTWYGLKVSKLFAGFFRSGDTKVVDQISQTKGILYQLTKRSNQQEELRDEVPE